MLPSLTSATHSSASSTFTDETPPRVLVPEKLSPDGLALLTEANFEVDNRPGLTAQEIRELIPSYHALIVRSETRVTDEVLSAGTKLRVVARAGVGVDNIDVNAATSRGILVVNSPAGNILAAAEHTIALLLASARNVGRADAGVKGGKWERGKLVGVEVGSKTLGIVGLGKVGMEVARMAIGLGMKVLGVDPYMSAEKVGEKGVKMVAGLDKLLPQVDFLTIHTPLAASTLNLLGEKELKVMKKTARVLNVARGGIYNEEALVRALDEGTIAGAGIDVFTSEPIEPGSAAEKLASHPNVVATPHLGASTVEAQENVSLDVCHKVVHVLRGGIPHEAVNIPLILPEEYRKLQPFVGLVQQMGNLYTQHFVGSKGGMVGGRKFELIYHGELAGVANTRPLLAALIKGLTSSISDSGGRDVNIVNAQLIAKEKGISINETHAREAKDLVYASLVTLRSYDGGPGTEQVIEGFVSGQSAYISRLDRFTANFVPEGTMLLLHNYDEPGKIGDVGMILGSHAVNINFMQVASVDRAVLAAREDNGVKKRKTETEALMILGVGGDVTAEVLEELRRSEGILDVNLVKL
ncbi:unnamed protein product [Discula destructiva]